jgi:SAM-dependent methyltransferase
MVHDLQHRMLARPDAEEAGRQRFVLAMKRYLTGRIRPGNADIYEREVAPGFAADHDGRAPATRAELRGALLANPHYQTWCSLNRSSQEMMWQAVGETVLRESDRMRDDARTLAEDRDPLGGLRLNPHFDAPEVLRRVNIHLQPGGYARTLDERDILAGAFYESGGNLYSMGRGMGGKDSKAGAAIRWLAEQFPGFRPRRVLDMGCSAGASSVPYAQAFPDAEVHALDIGGAMLRYAHARAEALGARVFFHQLDAAATDFPDGHFDLVVSHNLFHEISDDTRRGMLGETWRLLAPGGVALHQDVAIQNRTRSLFEQVERSWDVEFNNEPFWESYADADIVAEMREAGFAADACGEFPLPKISGPGHWFAIYGRKPG